MNFNKLLELIQQGKINNEDLVKIKQEAQTKPEEFMKAMGFDVSELKKANTEELQNKAAELKNLTDDMENKMFPKENKKAASFKNFLNKLNSLEDPSLKDMETLLKLFKKFSDEEKLRLTESCFHWDTNSCKGGVIDAHSLQKSGALKRISQKIGNEIKVIHFIKDVKTRKKKAPQLEHIKNASTFRGFCDHHDKIFSKTIEKDKFYNSSKHKFLHSYRSFAYSNHRANEEYAAVLSLAENITDFAKSGIYSLYDTFLVLGVKPDKPTISGILDVNPTQEQLETLKAITYSKYKSQLNEYLKLEQFDELDYIVYEIDYMIPFACSSWVRVDYDIQGGFIVDHKGELYCGNPAMLTVFSEENKTIVILARFKSDNVSKLVFDRLRESLNSNHVQFEMELSTIIIEKVENFYLAPTYWNRLSEKEQKLFINELSADQAEFPYESTFRSSINLFGESL